MGNRFLSRFPRTGYMRYPLTQRNIIYDLDTSFLLSIPKAKLSVVSVVLLRCHFSVLLGIITILIFNTCSYIEYFTVFFFTARCEISFRVWKIAWSDTAPNRREYQKTAHETWKASAWIYSFPALHVRSLGSRIRLSLRTASPVKLSHQSGAEHHLIPMCDKGLCSYFYRYT